MELLIPLLFFAIPVAIAILDRRARAGRSAAPQAPAIPADKLQEAVRRAVEENVRPEEGIRAIHNRQQAEPGSPPAPQEPHRQKIDKKKLILYSELLKPKFDE